MQKTETLREALRDLLSSGFDGNQTAICEQMRAKGLTVTQSTVSRGLKAIGARKISIAGQQRYELAVSNFAEAFEGKLQSVVRRITCNESLIVIKTTPGSAMFLAGFIDHHCAADVLGSVAGDDTIFVAPVSCGSMQKHLENVARFLAGSS
jgi:transcriptional regulator of arginine metabolism